MIDLSGMGYEELVEFTEGLLEERDFLLSLARELVGDLYQLRYDGANHALLDKAREVGLLEDSD